MMKFHGAVASLLVLLCAVFAYSDADAAIADAAADDDEVEGTPDTITAALDKKMAEEKAMGQVKITERSLQVAPCPCLCTRSGGRDGVWTKVLSNGYLECRAYNNAERNIRKGTITCVDEQQCPGVWTYHKLANSQSKCLDGTPGAYYIRYGANIDRVYFHLQGGGWCSEIGEDTKGEHANCATRAFGELGSTKSDDPATFTKNGGHFSDQETKNPGMLPYHHYFLLYNNSGKGILFCSVFVFSQKHFMIGLKVSTSITWFSKIL